MSPGFETGLDSYSWCDFDSVTLYLVFSLLKRDSNNSLDLPRLSLSHTGGVENMPPIMSTVVWLGHLHTCHVTQPHLCSFSPSLSLFSFIYQCARLQAQASFRADTAQPFHLPYSFLYAGSCSAFMLPRNRKTLQASVTKRSPCSWAALLCSSSARALRAGTPLLTSSMAGLGLRASLLP